MGDKTRKNMWTTLNSVLVMVLVTLLIDAPVGVRANVHTSTTIDDVRVTGGDGLVYVAWNAPSTVVTDYVIEYCTIDGCQRYADEMSPLTSAIVHGLNNNQPYTFRVQAVHDRRVVATSDSSVAVTPRSTFRNGSFESDAATNDIATLTGWTLVGANSSNPTDRVNLEVTTLGGCPSQDTTDYQTTQLRGSDAPEHDDPSPINTFISKTSLVTWISEITPSHGINMLMLKNDVVAGPPIPNGHHVVHGPAIVSDEFSATAGQVITLDWFARYVRDDYAILGYLLDTATCTQYEIIDASGDSVSGWQNARLTIPATKSTYRLVFVHGTFDKSGGRFSGAEIYVDNITLGAGQIVTFPAIATKNFTDPAFSIAATSSVGLPVSFVSLTPLICGVSGATVSLITAGECTIQASQSGGSIGGTPYAASAKVNRTFTVTGFTPTRTPTFTATPTFTFTPSRTRTPTNTFTPSLTPTHTLTPTQTLTPTRTLSPTNTRTPTRTFTPSPTLSMTPHPLALRGVAVGSSFTLAVMNNGTLTTWGFNREGQASIPSWMQNIPVRQVATGSNYAIALGENGRVYGWGKNDFGQLNIPPDAERDVVMVSASFGHVMALKTDGSIVLWGRNDFRQLNPLDARLRYQAVAAGHDFSIVVTNSGTVTGWGRSDQNQLRIPANLRNVVAVSAGFNHALALTRDGTVVCWGSNRSRQCDVPRNLRNITAISAGREYSMAMTNEGVVYAWGRNEFGQSSVPRLPFAATSIGAGYGHSVIGLRNAAVIAIGSKLQGALVSRTPTMTP